MLQQQHPYVQVQEAIPVVDAYPMAIPIPGHVGAHVHPYPLQQQQQQPHGAGHEHAVPEAAALEQQQPQPQPQLWMSYPGQHPVAAPEPAAYWQSHPQAQPQAQPHGQAWGPGISAADQAAIHAALHEGDEPGPRAAGGVGAPPPRQPWVVSMVDSAKANVRGCLYALMCPYCPIYRQRKRLLLLTNEPYSCFQAASVAGAGNTHVPFVGAAPRPPPSEWPPLPSAYMPDSFLRYDSCQWNLCLEVAVCPCASMLANRRLIKSRFAVDQGGECDDAVCANCAYSWDQISCYLRCAYPCLPCSFCVACAHTQQQAQMELEERRLTARLSGRAPADRDGAGADVAMARVGRVQGGVLRWEPEAPSAQRMG